jgi:hypothetical protein
VTVYQFVILKIVENLFGFSTSAVGNMMIASFLCWRHPGQHIWGAFAAYHIGWRAPKLAYGEFGCDIGPPKPVLLVQLYFMFKFSKK